MWPAAKFCLRAQIVLYFCKTNLKFADAIILVIRVMPMTLKCTEIYLVIKPLDNWKNISRPLETCLSDVSVWMSSTMFRLNQNNTAYCICTKHREKEFSECCLSFDGTIVINASFVKNLGMCFDRTLCMQKQASAITKSCYFQIRNIGRNRSYTTEDACKILVCSLITSRLDCGQRFVV
jgi:hypothetical protein